MSGMMSIFSNVSKGQVFSYLFMPQIMPRIQEFYRTGFSRLAYMIALVYKGVGILPPNHFVFERAKRQHLSLREVMAGAASELKFDRYNIDKVIIYFLILAGLILLVGQFVLTIGYLMVNPALAGNNLPITTDFFATPNYETDIAYRMLFSVFGVPELFYVGGARNEFHIALHALLQFYSIGLLVIGVIITCYYIFAVLAETAETGVPFGKRYNHVWTPIRLVVALGLLIPMGYGLNAAQWITLYAAKFGSDFATQGWVLFNTTMNEAYLSKTNERVGRPQNPDLVYLARFMTTMHACKLAYETEYGVDPTNGRPINAYLVKSTANSASSAPMSNYTFHTGGGRSGRNSALDYFNKGDILIRFGHYKPESYKENLGGVIPYCGEIKLSVSDMTEPGSLKMQESYFSLIFDMFSGVYNIRNEASSLYNEYKEDSGGTPTTASPSRQQFKRNVANTLDVYVSQAITDATNLQATSSTWASDITQIRELGWGGAGMWYNKIAQINGSLVTSVNATPAVTRQASLLDYINTEQRQNNQNSPNPGSISQADGTPMEFSAIDKEIASALTKVDAFWTNEDLNQGEYGGQAKSTPNMFVNVINLIFGTRGLFNMCANTDVHPLAQLSILGKGLVEASIRNLGMALGFGVVSVLPLGAFGMAAGVAASVLSSVASITLSMGFLLFYVLPFMPFLYFFFAVGGWIKGLFEAMVGVPLWALAHLRIDGEGLPGDAAMDGYYLIFEIFLRPILIVFGLLASVIIFASMVKVLNEIYTLVVTNLAGHDESFSTLCGVAGTGGGNTAVAFFRGPVDELFYTVLYAIIVYMIGMSCFKLIDLIPNNILRYMGSRASSYNDTAQDPAEGLMFKLSIGSSQVTGQLVNIGKQGGAAAGNFIKGGIEVATPKADTTSP